MMMGIRGEGGPGNGIWVQRLRRLSIGLRQPQQKVGELTEDGGSDTANSGEAAGELETTARRRYVGALWLEGIDGRMCVLAAKGHAVPAFVPGNVGVLNVLIVAEQIRAGCVLVADRRKSSGAA